MSEKVPSFDVVVVGSGPAGHKAAIQAAQSGATTAIVEAEPRVGGSCVYSGTIPSKTLREVALRVARFRDESSNFELKVAGRVHLPDLLQRVSQVIVQHHDAIDAQLNLHGVQHIHGRAGIVGPHLLEIQQLRGKRMQVRAGTAILAPGSHPYHPPEFPIDHEVVHDSDSILSMSYRPDSLIVVGGGVIAIEYASIFASLGAQVEILDKGPRPIPFIEQEIVEHMLEQIRGLGVRYRPNAELLALDRDGLFAVEAKMADGDNVRAEKALVAIGREANTRWLRLDKTRIEQDPRGRIIVDETFRTAEAWVFAVGDVVGTPSLASTAMEQGRRAALHALGLEVDGTAIEYIPTGIYSIPEISSVGLSESEAREAHGEVEVGRARFEEISRGQISGSLRGILKLVAKAGSRKLLGVSIIGDGATELIHIGQMALLAGECVDTFVNHAFNFPTLAEAYRVAALEIVNHHAPRSRRSEPTEATG